MNSYEIGDKLEAFVEKELKATRTKGSGAVSRNGDLMLVKDGINFQIECKSSKTTHKNKIYINPKQIESIKKKATLRGRQWMMVFSNPIHTVVVLPANFIDETYVIKPAIVIKEKTTNFVIQNTKYSKYMDKVINLVNRKGDMIGIIDFYRFKYLKRKI